MADIVGVALNGTDLKFVINIEAIGFNMADDDWSLVLRRNREPIFTYTKNDLILDEENNWILPITRDFLTVGSYDLVAYADIVDLDFDDGTRHEVAKISLIKIRNV